MYCILIISGGIALYLIYFALAKIFGTNLEYKFKKLGSLRDKTIDEIIMSVGKPDYISFAEDENGDKITICQWYQTGYHIGLIFDKNGICLRASEK